MTRRVRSKKTGRVKDKDVPHEELQDMVEGKWRKDGGHGPTPYKENELDAFDKMIDARRKKIAVAERDLIAVLRHASINEKKQLSSLVSAYLLP